MSNKQKKKRNKTYSGTGAKQTQPQVIRVEAIKRSRGAQWWHDNRSRIRLGAAIVLVVVVLLLVIIGIIQLTR